MDHSSSSAPIKYILPAAADEADGWITVVNRKKRNSKPPSSDVAGDEVHSQENLTTTEASESSGNVKKGKKKKKKNKKKKAKKVTVSENEEETDLATFAATVTVWDGSEKCKGVSEEPHRCIKMMPYVYLVFGLSLIALVTMELVLLELPEINYHIS